MAEAALSTKEKIAKYKAELKAVKEQEKQEKAEERARKKAEREARAAARAAGASPVYSRVDSITDFVKNNPSFTLDDITNGSNSAYATERKNQKADNPKEAKAICRWILKALVNVEYLSLNEGAYTLKK
jgi:hypothetical protein